MFCVLNCNCRIQWLSILEMTSNLNCLLTLLSSNYSNYHHHLILEAINIHPICFPLPMNLKQSSKMSKVHKKSSSNACWWTSIHINTFTIFRKPSKEVIFSLEIVNLHLETLNLSLDGLFGIFKVDPQEKLDGV